MAIKINKQKLFVLFLIQINSSIINTSHLLIFGNSHEITPHTIG